MKYSTRFKSTKLFVCKWIQMNVSINWTVPLCFILNNFTFHSNTLKTNLRWVFTFATISETNKKQKNIMTSDVQFSRRGKTSFDCGAKRYFRELQSDRRWRVISSNKTRMKWKVFEEIARKWLYWLQFVTIMKIP